jgi:predicted transcriptional regulator
MTKGKSPYGERLAQFGLTDNDSAVYLFLLERGEAFGGSKIAARLGIHRQYVYNSLQKLINLELVEQVSKEPRPKYQALPPQQLAHLARKRLQDTESTVRELDLISGVGATQDFEIYRGRKQIYDFEESVVHGLKENEIQYIMGGGAETFISFFGDDYEPISAVAKSKGLQTKYICSPGEIEWIKRAQAAVGKFEYRILAALPKVTVQTVIRFNTVTFYSFGTPPLVYVIKSKTAFEDYKKFFEMLWNMAGSVSNSHK